MTGTTLLRRYSKAVSVCTVALLALAACDENGEFAFPSSNSNTGSAAQSAQTPAATQTGERDVERPDIFEVTDGGLWDGRPSLGGVWVAHPDATDPERVMIRNTENGRSVVGALFRRERENPGPLLQVSSDAAEELGILAGAPTSLNVIALRREEVEVEANEAEINPVVADLATPVTVEETPLDPIENAAAAIAIAEGASEVVEAGTETAADVVTAPIEVNLPPAVETAVAAATPITVEAADVPLSGPAVQIGVFSVETNATGAADRLNGAGIPTSVLPEQAGGRTVWRVLSGPMANAESRDAALVQIKELGYVDAVGVEE